MSTEYENWLLDSSRDHFRILLIEIDYVGGTVFLANRHWLSREHVAYDDFLISSPSFDDYLEEFSAIGSFEAVNEDPELDWTYLQWYGQECRWYYGDTTWKKSQFKAIARATVEECLPYGNKRYKFNLASNAVRLDATFLTSPTVFNFTFALFVREISILTGLSIELVNIPDAKLNWQLTFSATETTKIGDLLSDMAESIGAYLRSDQLGNIQILMPSGNVPSLIDTDGITNAQISVREMLKPYATVVIVKEDGTEISGTNNILTGLRNEILTVNTLLVTTADANTLLNEKLAYYANVRYLWSIPVVNIGSMLVVGDSLSIIHPDLRDTGVITRVKNTPLEQSTIIEILI